MLHQPVHPALRPHAHCMEHEVANVGLRPLIHHIMVLVNMENVRWHYVVCPPLPPPSCKSVVVTFHHHGHGSASPIQETLQVHTWFRRFVEIIEVNVKDGVHRIMSLAEHLV